MLRIPLNLRRTGPGFLLILSVCAARIVEDYIITHIPDNKLKIFTPASVFLEMCLNLFVIIFAITPIVLIVWNFVLSPRFEVKRITFFDAAILAAAAYWIQY